VEQPEMRKIKGIIYKQESDTYRYNFGTNIFIKELLYLLRNGLSKASRGELEEDKNLFNKLL
jgi:hypothetical protein